MKSEPQIGKYYDEEEKNLIGAIEKAASQPNYRPVSKLDKKRAKHLHQAAQNSIGDTTERVTLNIAQTDLIKLKAQALREGMPYQTWMQSILHKSIQG